MSNAPAEQAPARGSAAETRAAIFRAATRLFYRHGFAGASVRAIAAEAGADPALVIRYFGSKERLFLETVALEGEFDLLPDAPLGELGRRLVRTVLADLPEPTFEAWRAMVSASGNDGVRQRLIEVMDQVIIGPLAPRLQGTRTELRARLIAAQVAGLLDAVAVLGDEHISAATVEDLEEIYGDAIQAIIDKSG